ncbi:WhiB family transcriptional regulator [Phytomonospora sp. NPDC050363]|uniref:WhiB family transcriptional regulator n=1 Tax=Phytomonospora sp. NPDC050363 TaxID=3155642 RepID=UPI0033F8B3E0
MRFELLPAVAPATDQTVIAGAAFTRLYPRGEAVDKALQGLGVATHADRAQLDEAMEHLAVIDDALAGVDLERLDREARTDAVCAQTPPELVDEVLFPDDTNMYASATARAMCARCPSRGACALLAVAHSDTKSRVSREDGVWGGITPRGRNRVLKLLAAYREIDNPTGLLITLPVPAAQASDTAPAETELAVAA